MADEKAYQIRWLEYFSILDVDRNGYIDPADLQHTTEIISTVLQQPEDSPEVQKGIAGYRALFQGIMRDFDLNKDGKVTKEELLAGVEKHFVGKTRETVPDWWQDAAKKLFEACDTNGNGELSLEEVSTYIKRVDPEMKDEDIVKGYEWLKKLSPTGKCDAAATSNLLFFWATSHEHPPELETVAVSLRKRVLRKKREPHHV